MLDKMIENMPQTTGKTLEQWIEAAGVVKNLKHKEAVKYMQNTYGLGLNYADVIIHKMNKTDSGSQDGDLLIAEQYKGKEHLKPIYDGLMEQILSWGDDIEIAPKKAYVSLRRKKQFACLKPATKTRFELELILKGQEPTELLHLIPGAGAMCTHKILIETPAQITNEVLNWAKLAYDKAL
jgi:predicted transport protein